jgi:hypothetical protein
MVKDMNVVELTSGEQIYSEYEKAMNSDVPTLLVEYADLYNMNLIYDIEKSKDLK